VKFGISIFSFLIKKHTKPNGLKFEAILLKLLNICKIIEKTSMTAYKYYTKISKEGAISIPLNPALYDQVEITIVSKKSSNPKNKKAKEFVEKWGGFLKLPDNSDTKLEYLSEKYK
jgi:hypothetical protein